MTSELAKQDHSPLETKAVRWQARDQQKKEHLRARPIDDSITPTRPFENHPGLRRDPGVYESDLRIAAPLPPLRWPRNSGHTQIGKCV
jgi:hypothetical protein